MNLKINPMILIVIALFTFSNIFAQFSTESYKQFLSQNENLSSEELLGMYNSGLFTNTINAVPNESLYFDSIKIKYELTNDEIDLISKHGFVVTERLQEGSFGKQFANIYHKDLPVFISSDAILHAFHMSYDKILKDTEISVLIPKVEELIDNLRNNFASLESHINTQANLDLHLKDLDVYLSVAKSLISNSVTPYYPESNNDVVQNILKDIDSETFVNKPLFSITPRKIDYSQFKPRGHYDDEYNPILSQYFKTMMWFGKTELYLIAPKSLQKVPIEDEQRQIIMAYLFSELIEISNSRDLFEEIEYIIKTFVGEQDNVTFPQLEDLFIETGISTADQLLDTNIVKNFQNTLMTKEYAGQKILSQILISNPFSPDKIEPASAFMPFGQRFVIDSYITGSVVYDKVKKKRMLPSTLDILFSLGNDAAAQLLQEEIEFYDYSKNLAGLRYLIDSYDDNFWDNSIYNLWLNSIRSLNPKEDRSTLPSFMQTAAWWQQKMNSQLSSWTELRHDNLLYAKQSYSGGATCSYPYSYVEPVPIFYRTIGVLAKNTLEKLNSISSFEGWTKLEFQNYFTNFQNVADTLEIISEKELQNISLNDDELYFLQRMLYNNPQQGCGGPEHVGWYPRLYYSDYDGTEMKKEDYVVADYHTAPTDAGGNYVGWVKHAGTGPIDLAVIITPDANGREIAYVGPVASYYEYTSTNFYRLTDDEWKESYLDSDGMRPDWTNIYLADNEGSKKEIGLKLLTSVQNDDDQKQIPSKHIIAQNYPNPFNPSTIIQFTIPHSLNNEKTTLRVFNLQGELIKELVNKDLPSGTYMTRWNGDNSSGNKVSSGVYFYEVNAGINKYVGKMNLVK